MTRKHFNAIARLVNDIATNGGSAGAEYLAFHLSAICADGNPNFDRDRFLAACFKNSKFSA